MTPPVRHLFHGLAACCAAAALFSLWVAARALGAAAASAERARPAQAGPAQAGPPAPALLPEGGPLAGLAAVLAPAAPAEPGALARRFRLAGIVRGASEADALAILDDRVEVRQGIVPFRGEAAPGIVLVAVAESSVTLAGPDGEETIAIERAPRPVAAAKPSPAAAAAAAPEPEDGRAAAAARFGGREDFPGRWIYDRAKVLDYYEELRAEPERMLRVFDSMDPVYVTDADGERRIEGYRVGVEGEADLFAAAGLKDGDVVKSVNNLLMSRRDRAESLLSAFIEGRGSMFVFEIERDGRTFKQVVDFE